MPAQIKRPRVVRGLRGLLSRFKVFVLAETEETIRHNQEDPYRPKIK